jgi:hypothetical protein
MLRKEITEITFYKDVYESGGQAGFALPSTTRTVKYFLFGIKFMEISLTSEFDSSLKLNELNPKKKLGF